MVKPVDVFVSRVRSLPRTISAKPPDSVLEIVGIDPILELRKFKREGGARIFAKVEFLNPTGSIKDTMVLRCIKAAERRGELKRKHTIVEATSGNTGVALAMVAAVRGYEAVIVMPDGTSEEKKDMMRSFGAKLVFTPDSKGIAGVVERAKRIAKRKRAFFLNQFENPDNPRSHHELAREIMKQLGNKEVDAFVASIGTGGTVVGVAQVLKEANPSAKVVAVEPAKVPAFYNMFYGKRLNVPKRIVHRIEGIGEGFVPKILSDNKGLIDDVMLVKDEDAIGFMKRLVKEEGLFAGMSSGANVWASSKVAKRLGRGKNVVTVLPDTGQRYLSKGVFK